jgi:predicted nucleotidyltransferase
MDRARKGGIARAKKLSPTRRRQIARRAARKRWARGASVLSISQIRTAVRRALVGRRARALLFGSYARGEAKAASDIDIMVIEAAPCENILDETSDLREKLRFAKNLDLIVTDEDTFQHWKNEYGTVHHEAARDGIKLV